MSHLIRQRMSGDRRRGSLSNLVRTRVGSQIEPAAPVAMRSFFRYMSCVGPQAPVGFEDASWTFGSYPTGSGYMLYFDHAAAPTYTVPFAPTNHWVRKLAPMRFKIDHLVGAGGSSIGWRLIRQVFESSNPEAGHSALTLPASSHMTPARLTHAKFPTRGFRRWLYSTGSGWSTEASVTHYRIWIDGVDVSGVVSLGGSGIPLGTFVSPGTSYASGGLTDALPIPNDAHTAKTVEVDFWILLDTFGGPFVGSFEYPLIEIDPAPVFARAEFLSANANERRKSADKYRLTFSSGGPASSIVLEAQAGWTYSETATSKTINNGSWEITLDWSREYVLLSVGEYSQINSPANSGAIMRYLPADSGDYNGLQFRNTTIIKPGVWNARGTTTFSIRQRQVAPAYGHLHEFITEGGSPESVGTWPSSLFSAFPASIIVEKV